MIAKKLIGKKFPVLDGGYVRLVDAMPRHKPMEDRCVNVSRLSYRNKRITSDSELWSKLVNLGGAHIKALEWPTFDFEIKAPVVVWWQWDTYRIGRSFMSESGRRVRLEEYYNPLGNSELSSEVKRHYARCVRLYDSLMEQGVKREQARLVLPFGAAYYVRRYKTDAKSLLHFLTQRLNREAQWEIRQYARCIYEHIYTPLLPITAATLGSLYEADL